MRLNRPALDQLIAKCKNDIELLEAIQDAIKSFEDYHSSIFYMETRKRILADTVEPKKYQEEVTAMDNKRTSCHNAVLANVSMLNRLAEINGLPPIYDGTISKEQPYRRQVADSVLDYVREIILERP